MYPNLLKQRLRDGEIILGSALPAPSPHAAGTVLDTNPDFLWADTEHMPYGTEALDSILVLSRMRGVAPMVRVAWNDPALIKKAYDAGAVAVMVPQIDTAEAAALAVERARYAPQGKRGRKLLSLGGNYDLVKQGLSMGIYLKKGVPRLIINQRAAKVEGLDLAPAIRLIATTIK